MVTEKLEKYRAHIEAGGSIAELLKSIQEEAEAGLLLVKPLEEERQKLEAKLGRLYYEGVQQSLLEEESHRRELGETCEKIRELEDRIQEKQKEAEEIRREEVLINQLKPSVCQCGADVVPDSLFCRICGTRVEEVIRQQRTSGEPSPMEQPVKTCDCGHVLKPGAVFCGGCGKKTDSVAQETAMPAPEPAEVRQQVKPEPTGDETQVLEVKPHCTCGRPIKPGAVFCGGCGAKME